MIGIATAVSSCSGAEFVACGGFDCKAAGGGIEAGHGGDGGSDAIGNSAGHSTSGGIPDDGTAGTADVAGSGGSAACDGACTAAAPICNRASNECVQCIENGDCRAPTPLCDVTTHSCVVCAQKSDCNEGTKLQCDPAEHACVECLQQSDCMSGTASACVGNGCVSCRKDEDCSNIAGKGVCDAGTCVQCTGKKFAACGQDSGTPLVCDSLKRTCTTSKQQSAGLCQTCVTDAQCKAGQICVLDKFGNPAQDVGYFCHWKKGDTANGAPSDCFATGKPYAGTQVNATSVDGVVGDVCSLRVSTCVANNQFSAKDCAVPSAGSDAACGFAPTKDSKCAQVPSSSSYRCTMTCTSDEDCPTGTCDTGAAPRVCTFN